MAIFYSSGSLASAFSGLLAFAIEKMDGVGGLEGWRWIFILEGLVTVVLGVGCFWMLPDSPETASFLSPKERSFLATRLENDSGTSAGQVGTHDKFHWPTILAVFKDWKIYAAVVIFWVRSIIPSQWCKWLSNTSQGNTVSLYSFTYTVPSVILGLGYTAANAQLLTMPVYMLSVIGTPIIARFADKYKTRWPFIVGPYSVALIGFIGLLAIPHPRYNGLTYACLFLIPIGVNAPQVALISWVANNLAPSWKRAVGMALLMTIGNLGGAVGSNIFLSEQAPHYWLGYGGGTFICVAAIVTTIVLKFEYQRLNKAKEAEGTEEEVRARYTPEELVQMGDTSPLFKYIV